jgi:aryl-alcohol dehydrogenase-like predicted oxidoreductase
MPIDHYVTLGRSGLRVSPYCLGAMTFGLEWGFGSTPKESADILSAYLDQGGNFIDTANVYTKGHSEAILGDYYRRKGGRQRSVIATKFFGTLNPGDPNSGGAGRKAIMAACENSLRRLKTDYIDLYWMHCWDRFTPIEETMRALDDLVRAGKVRYIGFSDTPAWKVAQAQTLAALKDWSPLIALQIEYSLIQRTVEGELVPSALELGLGITPWSPLKSGVLSGKYTRENAGKVKAKRGVWVTSNLSERAYSIIDVLIKVAKEAGVTPAQAALSWLQAQKGVSSIIIGARTKQQLQDNLSACDVKLSPKQLAALSDVSKPSLNFPHDFVLGSGGFMAAGTTINGLRSEPGPLTPKSEKEVY